MSSLDVIFPFTVRVVKSIVRHFMRVFFSYMALNIIIHLCLFIEELNIPVKLSERERELILGTNSLYSMDRWSDIYSVKYMRPAVYLKPVKMS